MAPTPLFLCTVQVVRLYGNAYVPPLLSHPLPFSNMYKMVPEVLQELDFGFWNFWRQILCIVIFHPVKVAIALVRTRSSPANNTFPSFLCSARFLQVKQLMTLNVY